MSLVGAQNELIRIKPIAMEDLEDIHAYASNPNVKRYIGWQLKETEEQTAGLIELMLSRQEAKTHVYASVEEIATGRVIGTVMLFGFDWEANHGEIGYVFHEDSWGKGYATAAVEMVCEHAFKEMGLSKLFARVVSVNGGSARVLEKNGFSLEATLRDYYKIDGILSDCLYYSRRSFVI